MRAGENKLSSFPVLNIEKFVFEKISCKYYMSVSFSDSNAMYF